MHVMRGLDAPTSKCGLSSIYFVFATLHTLKYVIQLKGPIINLFDSMLVLIHNTVILSRGRLSGKME